MLEKVFGSAAKERKQDQVAAAGCGDDDGNGEGKAAAEEDDDKAFDDDDHGLQRNHKIDIDTTLTVYFFGRKGTDQLKFDDFHRFMENLQTEVLQMEFNEFAKGSDNVTELDFARLLLRYTFLNSEEYDHILNRTSDRMQVKFRRINQKCRRKFSHPNRAKKLQSALKNSRTSAYFSTAWTTSR